MRRMAGDLISLRAQLEALQAENRRLHVHLTAHHDPGLDLLSDTDLDVMTKTEMADRIASLSGRLSNERKKTATQTERIQTLQNQLIRKNDREMELLKMKSLRQKHPGRLQQEHWRMTELEVMVRHQGKAIEKMERLNSKRHKQSENSETEARAAAAETPLTRRVSPFESSKATVNDRDDLLEDLKRTETRRLVLEQQLEENSKLWGNQKQQMLIHLSEHRHGLVQKPSTLSQK